MIEKLRIAVITFILLVHMRVFHNLLSRNPESSDTANVHTANSPLLTAVLLLAYVLLVLLVLPNIGRIASVIFHDGLMLATLLMVSLSFLWSVDLGFSLKRVVLFLASTTFAIYIGQRYDIEEIQRIFRNTILIIMGLSVFLLLVAPRVVMDPENPGLFRGVASHKNAFGLDVALLAVLFLAGGMRRWRPRVVSYLVFLCTLGLMALAHSGTALLSFAAVAAMFPVLKALQRRPSLLWPKILLGALLATPLVLTFTGGLDSVFGSVLRKNATLTGRTELWSVLIDAVEQKPYQGYGYDAYLGSQGPEWSDTVKKVRWMPAHAHNGYIQIALATGLVGLGLFAALLVRCVSRGVTFARENPEAIGLLPLAVLILLIIQNVAETTFLESSGPANVWFFAAYVSMLCCPRLAGTVSPQEDSTLSEILPTVNIADADSAVP